MGDSNDTHILYNEVLYKSLVVVPTLLTNYSQPPITTITTYRIGSGKKDSYILSSKNIHSYPYVSHFSTINSRRFPESQKD